MMPLALLLLSLACGRTQGTGDDSGATGDAGTADSGTSDGGTSDGGTSDSGTSDGGTSDGGTTPLGALSDLSLSQNDAVVTLLELHWTQTNNADAAWITYSFEDQVLTSPVLARAAGSQSEVLLGIPPETQVTATLTLQTGDESLTSEALIASTGTLPADLDVPDLVQWDPVAAASQRYALTAVNVGSYDFYGPCYVVIVDRQGRIVWYDSVDDSRLTWQPRISLDGTHLLYEASTYYVYDDSVQASIKRLTLDNAQVDETFIEGLGLAWSEMPDGSFVFGYAESGYEFHLERISADGMRSRIWSCYPWMKKYDNGYWACNPNAIVVDFDRNTALYSMFDTSTIVEIDLDSGEMLRQFGQVEGSYVFDPDDSVFDLQHYPNWTPDGTLLLSTHAQGNRRTQFIREYSVNDKTQTLDQIWSYQEPAGYYADYAGGALRIDNGNTMISVGTDGAVLEVDPKGEIVWELDWHGHLIGNVTALDDLYALNQGW